MNLFSRFVALSLFATVCAFAQQPPLPAGCPAANPVLLNSAGKWFCSTTAGTPNWTLLEPATGIASLDGSNRLLPGELPQQIPWSLLSGAAPSVSIFANDAGYATTASVTALQTQFAALQTQLTQTQAAIASLQSATPPASTGTNTPPPVTTPPTPTYTAAAKLIPSAQTAAVGTSVTIAADHPVSWSLLPGSLGALSNQTPTSVTYTAPATAPQPQNAEGGCPVSPSDSVYNTRIDSLPVDPNSAAWVGVTTNPIALNADFGTNILDNSTPAANQSFYYTSAYNSTPFQIAPAPGRYREMGSLANDGGVNDHHLISVNHQTCQFYETYQDGNNGANSAQSGYSYNGNSYAMPTAGTTDAAGLPLAPLVLHLSELRAGAINHALRLTLCTGCISNQGFRWPATGANGSNIPITQAPPNGARFRLKSSWSSSGVQSTTMTAGGSGYATAPAVTVSGCVIAPNITASVNAAGAVSSLKVIATGTGCKSPTIAFTGSSGTGATARANLISQPVTPNQQAVFNALQQYGMILGDNGGSGQIQVDADITQDHSVFTDISHIAWDNIGITQNFEAVDESSLQLAPNSIAVNTAVVTPVAFARVAATDASANVSMLPISIQPVTVGVPYQTISFVAGAPAYQLGSWVNGSSNQAVTWTLTSGTGTLTSTGLYTPPATATALSQVVFTCTSAADSTATAVVHATVIPVGSDGSVRIDSGNFGTAYTDKAKNVWQPDLIAQENISNNPINDGYPLNLWSSTTVVDPFLFQYAASSQGADVVYGPIVVPNGNYKITFTTGIPNCSSTWTPGTWDGNLTFGPLALESQGQIQDTFNPAAALNNTCRTPIFYSFPASVANSVMTLAWRATTWSGKHSVPVVTTLQIAPDATTPHLAINAQGVTTVSAGSTAQLTAVGWYMPSIAVWTASDGTITQAGLYSAPATAPATAETVTITATSTVNPAVSATAAVTIPAVPPAPASTN